MPKAIWNKTVIAEADDADVQRIEGNIYFPKKAIKAEFIKLSAHKSVCPWKGMASYYSVEVDGKTNPDAAWYYPEPKEKAAAIKDYVAFWKGVEVR